jgi:ribonucleotide reductase alpha subunit
MILKYHLGKKRSKETCEKISKVKKQQSQNPLLRKKISIATKIGMEENWLKFFSYIKQRAEKKLLDAKTKTNLQCFLKDNSVYVYKKCELCNKDMTLPFSQREVSYHKDCWVKLHNENQKKKQNLEVYSNHKVKSVEFCGYEDVYNGTVDDLHNLYIGHFAETIDGDNCFTYINTLQCGEVPLPDYGACCLGSINISKFVKYGKFDFEDFRKYIELATRALMNNNAISWYPLPQIDKTMKELNPIGVGLMGFADALIKMEIRYDSEESLKFIDKLVKYIKKQQIN